MRAQLTNRDYEQLSAYLDGQLAPSDKRKLEERMQSRPELQAALEELNRTRALIRMAPRRRAPRNFTLTPAMVGDTGPGRKQKGGLSNLFGLFPALSFASAVATLLLVATLFFDLGQGRQPAPTTVAMEQPAMEAQTAEEAQRANEPQAGVLRSQPTAPAGADPSIMAVPEAAEGGAAQDMAQKGMDEYSGPIVTWNMPEYGRGGGGGYDPGYAYGMGGASAPPGLGGGAPDMVWGKGGDPSIDGMQGVYPNGQIMLPPESVEAMDSAPAAAAEAPQAEEEQAQSDSTASVTGTGPILGIPQAEKNGQILGRSSVGRAVPGLMEELPAAPAGGAANPAAEQPVGAAEPGTVENIQQPWWEREALGLALIRWLQISLALAAAAFAIMAVLVRRQAK